jgi:hypothetical protein
VWIILVPETYAYHSQIENTQVELNRLPDDLARVMPSAQVDQRIREMSHQERVQSLKDAGILTARGNLAPHYR